VLLPRAAAITGAHERLAPRVDEALLAGVTASVPDDWFQGDEQPGVYLDYLNRRLRSGAFATEAERARTA
jgi:hypothetical protein